MGINVQDLPDVLGIGRASLFCCRTGKRPITPKTWLKLAAAEREAGIGQPASIEPEAQAQDEPSNIISLSDRMERVETLLEELLAELRGKDNQATSSKARGEKFR